MAIPIFEGDANLKAWIDSVSKQTAAPSVSAPLPEPWSDIAVEKDRDLQRNRDAIKRIWTS